MEAVASARGVAVLVSDVPRGGGHGARMAQLLDAGRADGALLLHGAPLPGADRPGRGWKLVSVSEELPPGPAGSPRPCHVGIDNRAAAAAATAHLIALGHRRIAHVTGPADTILTRQRGQGYHDAMTAAGLGDRVATVPGDFTIGSGYRAAVLLQDAATRPDAVFCANDEMALGVLNGLAAAGIAVPGSVSVMGFDDIGFAAWSTPALSTVRQPRDRIGRLAMTELLSQIDGGDPAPPIQVPFEIVGRASTCRR